MPQLILSDPVLNDFSAVLRDLHALADATITSATEQSIVLSTAAGLGIELRGRRSDPLTTETVDGRSYVSGGNVRSIVLRGEGGVVLAEIEEVNLDGAVLGGCLQDEWGSSTSAALETWMNSVSWRFIGVIGPGAGLLAPFVTDDGVTVGFDGNDTVGSGGREATIFGGGGDDDIAVESGANFLDGGAGNDSIRGGGPSLYFGGAGDDAIIASGEDGNLWGGEGDDHIYFSGSYGSPSASGGPGRDWIGGERGDDRLKGNGGHDTLMGYYGDDRLYGAGGRDLLDGTFNNDMVFGGKDDDTGRGGEGDDTVYGDDGNDLLEGGFGDDTVYGGAGDDVLGGWESGNDLLSGGDGDDSLLGDNGYEQFVDGESDTLHGGQGTDTLTGGAGHDVFLFASPDDLTKADAPDTITDFATGADVIDLTGLGVVWRGEGAFVAGAAQARWSAAAGRIVIDTDGNGSGDRVIVVQGDAPLGVGDVLV